MANITPVTYPLEFTKNDDWYREIKVFADNEKITPFPFSASWSAIMQVKKRSYGNPVVAEFKTSDATMVLTTGFITLNLPRASTNVPAEEYIYDIEFKDLDLRQITHFETSPFVVKPEITDGAGI